MKQFLKYLFLMLLPIYGLIMWEFLKIGMTYWWAWFLTGIIYAIITFPLVKKGVFKL
jgi:hypothetical protein